MFIRVCQIYCMIHEVLTVSHCCRGTSNVCVCSGLLLKAFLISILGMTVHAAVTVKLTTANTLRLSQPQEMCQKNCSSGGETKKKTELVLFLLSLFKVRN